MGTPNRIGLVALLAAFACKPSADDDGEDDARPAAPPPTPIDPSTIGAIEGTVRFEGTVPTPKELPVSAEPACASQHEGPVLDEPIVAAEGRLANAFAYIKGGLGERRFAVPEQEVVIDQLGCVYQPRVVGVQVGQPITFVNSDPVLHNVHLTGNDNRDINFGMPNKGMRTTKKIKKPEVAVITKCDVHPWMRAYVAVVGNPFFAVSGADGTFSLAGVPEGSYELEVWHETLGTQSAKVDVTAGETASVQVGFASE